MKFREGDAVEVLRRGGEQYDCWFPGKIISADRDKFTVRYEVFINQEGDSVVEEVCEGSVRPPPPAVKGGRWDLGDIVEVFDHHYWRAAKVAKVLSYNRFVIKPLGSIQLKEFRRSNLRIQQAWQNNKWVVLEKVGGSKQIYEADHTSKYYKGGLCSAPEQVIHKEGPPKENGRQDQFKAFPPVKTFKRKYEGNLDSSPVDEATAGVVKEKRPTRAERLGMVPIRTPPFLNQVALGSFPANQMGKKRMIKSKMDVETKKTNNYVLHPYAMPVRVTNESSGCSVASCSGNDLPEDSTWPSHKSALEISSSSFNHSQSLCASGSGRKHLPYYPKAQLEADIHKLELHAYKLTMQAMYASGPLSWEQESLLTNLRLSLHISNEEHLLHLRHLLSSQVL